MLHFKRITNMLLVFAMLAALSFQAGVTPVFAQAAVYLSGNVGMEGAAIRYTDGSAKAVLSAPYGSYTLAVPYGWSGTATPVKAGYSFSPASRSYSNITESKSGYYFMPSLRQGAFTQLSVGPYHSCALKTDRSVACWGDNAYGQASPPAGGFMYVAAGYYHSCGVRSDTTLVCWGSEQFMPPPPAGSFSEVTAGYYFSCGIKSDRSVACWGQNESGQATPPGGYFEQLSAGTDHICGVNTAESLVCWGSNGAGQATAPTGSFSQIDAGNLHTCGVTTAGAALCWGDNVDGQSTPPAGHFSHVSAGEDHSCGVKADGSMACWGYNDSNGKATPPAANFTEGYASSSFTCGLNSAGGIACWGANGRGELNHPRVISGNAGVARAVLSYVDGSAKSVTADSSGNYAFSVPYGWSGTVTAINGGDSFSPASRGYTNVTADQPAQHYSATPGGYTIVGNVGVAGAVLRYTNGTALAAVADQSGNYSLPVPQGWNGSVTPVKAGYSFNPPSRSYANLAGNQTAQSYTPALRQGSFTQLSVGPYHGCALKTDGTIACWGDNSSGKATPPAGTFISVAAGHSHTCGVRSDGTVVCWGSSFMAPPPGGSFLQVSSDYYVSCGLRVDRTLACWGHNTTGQATPPAGTFIQLDISSQHGCALRSDRSVACWGNNSTGQATPPPGSFSQVSASDWHSCGVRTDGTVACWGEPYDGKTIVPLGSFTQVSAGEEHSCAVQPDGAMVCWGYNGNLKATPPAGSFSESHASRYHSCGLKSDGGLACWGNNGLAMLDHPRVISGNAGVVGAVLSYVDGTAKSVTADSAGGYAFSVPYGWSGTVTASKPDYSFSPASRGYTNVTADQGAQTYSAAQSTATRIKAITFEDGQLINASSGVDTTVGSVTLETTTPLLGRYAVTFNNTKSSLVREDIAAVDEIYATWELHVTRMPTTTIRLARFINGPTGLGYLNLMSTGQLSLGYNGTEIGTSTTALTLGSVYRVGLRQKRGTGSNAILEAFVAPANSAFGAPFASSSNLGITLQTTRFDVGTISGYVATMTVDNIVLDRAILSQPSQIKAITFENQALVHPLTGVDYTVGSAVLETQSPLKGTASAAFKNSISSYLREDIPAVDELYVTFDLRITTLPTTTLRVARILNGVTTQGYLQLLSSGKLRLVYGSTVIGTSATALTVGSVYRIGLRQRKGTGANALLQAYLASANSNFGAPFAGSPSLDITTPATRFDIGSITTYAGNMTMDTITLHTLGLTVK